MDAWRALSFMFRDPGWPDKIALAVLCTFPAVALNLVRYGPLVDRLPAHSLAAAAYWLLPSLASVPLLGYGVRVTRRVVAGEDLSLPSWDDPGGLLSDGLKAWVVLAAWNLPSTLVGLGLGQVVRLLGSLAMLVAFVIEPAAMARLAVTRSLTAALDVPAAVRLVVRPPRAFLVLAAMVMAFFFAVSVVGRVVLGRTEAVSLTLSTVGQFLALTGIVADSYGQLVLSHLAGQAYRRATGALARAVSPGDTGDEVLGVSPARQGQRRSHHVKAH